MRRQQIVETTLSLLAELPLAELTTRRIARAVGVSQPALFRHFTSREGVLLEVLEHARRELATIVEPALAASREPDARLTALAHGLFAYIERRPGLPRLLFADVGPSPAGTAVRDGLRRLVGTQHALVTEIVRDGITDGALRADLHPSRAAAYFIGLLQAGVLQWELDGRTRALGDDVAPLVRFWLSGAGARPGADRDAMQHRARSVHDDENDFNRVSGPLGVLRTLDVRPILASGADPLEEILAALDANGPTGVLCLTAPFRPAPLIGLLAGRGHEVVAWEGPAGTWSIDVVVGGAPGLVDLSELPAPEPLERVLQATARLAEGEVFVARTPRVPRLLLQRLAERPGLRTEVHEHPDGSATLRVTRGDEVSE